MQLEDIKKSMSTLDQILAKTNTEIKINISISNTSKSKILKQLRKAFVACTILAIVFAMMAIGNVSPQSFPNYIKISMSVCLAFGAIWYLIIYKRLNRINVISLTPAEFFSKTTHIKIMVISGEIFFIVCLSVFFTILFQSFWNFNLIGFWAMAATILFAIIYGIVYLWPQYIKLFRDLNSIRE